ncbi:hypothetical protein [Pseudomonas sp. S31]|uniref:hypothetical protein n=1 Tax=Pseudomonas sp. S31 TaxID=1564473 RepID=UPI001912241A|nr:hypothetical protein [Pseudomonas sp. S31]
MAWALKGVGDTGDRCWGGWALHAETPATLCAGAVIGRHGLSLLLCLPMAEIWDLLREMSIEFSRLKTNFSALKIEMNSHLVFICLFYMCFLKKSVGDVPRLWSGRFLWNDEWITLLIQ